MPTPNSHWLPAVAALALSGCGEDFVAGEAPVAALPASSLPGVYGGTFPCGNCSGIATTLWLHPDGAYFLRQRYLDEETRTDGDVYALGRWHVSLAEGTVVLAGPGPKRAFTRPDENSLQLGSVSEEAQHRLTRDTAAAPFTGRIALEGMVRIADGVASFAECLTGLRMPVEAGRDYPQLLRQYRRLSGRGEAALVEMEGRFSWNENGGLQSLSVERFVTLKPDGGC